VQIDPVLRVIEHLDLVIVRKGEKVTVDVALHLTGESDSGTIATLELQQLTVHAPATSIPDAITVDVEGLGDGVILRVADLTLPAGVTTDIAGDTAVVVVSTLRGEAETEEAAAETVPAPSAGGTEEA